MNYLAAIIGLAALATVTWAAPAEAGNCVTRKIGNAYYTNCY